MSETTVSVVMPIARIDAFVPAAIDSILQQQKVHVELILVGTPDSADAQHPLNRLVQNHYRADSRIVQTARPEAGIVSALNHGLSIATGEYIARMDADDVSHPERLYSQLQLAKAQQNASLVSTCVSIFSATDAINSGNQHYEHWLNSRQSADDIRHACFIESPLPHPSWFAHRSVWKQLGDYSQGDFPEDYDYVLRAWLEGIPMVKTAATLLQWREHANRLTNTDKRYRREAFTRLKAQTLIDSRSQLSLDTGRAVWIAGTGRNARYWHDALVHFGANVAGFIDLDHPKAKQQKRHKPVIRYAELVRQRNAALVVSAITDPKARAQLHDWFCAQGWSQGNDFILGG